jgi:hypothetical protein
MSVRILVAIFGGKTMSKEQLHEILLPLDDIQELFVDPEPGSDRFDSGMDYIYGEVRVHTRVHTPSHKYKVTLELPPEKITEGLLESTLAKVRRYCEFKVEQNHKDLRVLRLQGWDSLRRSIWVALVCVVLGMGASIYSQAGVNTVLEAILLFIIAFCVLGAGWVAVWMPFEYFLYDGWPFQQNMHIYQQIAEADFVIKGHEGGDLAQVKETGAVQSSSLS